MVKLGVMLGYAAVGGDRAVLRDYVQSLEGTGFQFVAAPEHVVGTHPDRVPGQVVHTYDRPYFEPIALFGFIAGATTTLEMATAILILPQRQTVLVAKQAAMVDVLCGGRLRLGVGVGRNEVEYRSLGEDFSTRGARLEEQLVVLRRLWCEELVTFEGRWHHLDEVGINPLPLQRPIPVWMGSFVGGTNERVLRRIATTADGWFPQASPTDLAPVLERVRAYASDAGRDLSTLGIECVSTIDASDDPTVWARDANGFTALGATHLKAVLSASATASPVASQLALLARWHDTVRAAVG
jgi:probable F420-dependent oxidoreductase